MNDKINPIRPTDDDARALAATLLNASTLASLGTVDPETGGPAVSRIIIAHFGGGRLVTMVSDLSLHTKALDRDPRCSLLIGEAGKGDPLAHPRMTVIANAVRLPMEAKEDEAFAGRFLALHPKTKLYFGFTDFAFWRFDLQRVDLNGGFGKAYRLSPADLASA
jgi:putative heme iron utilization protein